MPRARLVSVAFYSFAFAQLVSILGDRLHQFSVVGMIGMVEPGSTAELFQLSLFMFVPVLLFAPLFGALVDRANKAVLLVAVDVIRALIVLAIPTAYHFTGSLYAFYVPVFLLALANLIFLPAKSAIVPEAFGTDKLVQINALLWGVGVVGTLAGFLVGGWLIDYVSWELSFYSDAASYVVSIGLLLPLVLLTRSGGRLDNDANPTPQIPASQRPSIAAGLTNLVSSIRQGFAIIGDDRRIAFCLVVQTSTFAAMGILFVVGVARLQEVFPAGKTMYLSLVASAITIGLLAGAALSHLARKRFGPDRVVAGATLCAGVAWVGIAGAHELLPMIMWGLLLGVGVSPPLILTETLLQVFTPQPVRGRVFASREALTKTAFLATTTLGALATVILYKTVILTAVGVLLAVASMLLMRNKFLDA